MIGELQDSYKLIVQLKESCKGLQETKPLLDKLRELNGSLFTEIQALDLTEPHGNEEMEWL